MPVTIVETTSSRAQTIYGKTPAATLVYRAWGTNDEQEVRVAVESTFPAFYIGLQFDHYTLEPVEDDDTIWEARAEYALPEQAQQNEPPSTSSPRSFSFTTI